MTKEEFDETMYRVLTAKTMQDRIKIINELEEKDMYCDKCGFDVGHSTKNCTKK